MSELTARVDRQADRSVIHLSGYLSSESVAPLEEAFQQAVEAEKVLIVFEEKGLISSVGLALLFDLIYPAQEKGKQVRIVQPSKHFRKVFDLIGLSKDVEVFEDEEQAVTGW